MITPRTARLIRVPDLQTLHRTLIELLPSDLFAARDCAVIVPSHGSGRGAAEDDRKSLTLLSEFIRSARAVVLPEAGDAQ